MSGPRSLLARALPRIALLALLGLATTVPAGEAATRQIAVGADGDKRMSPSSSTAVQGDTAVFSWEDGGHDLVLAGPESTSVGEQDRGFRLTRTLNTPGTYTFLCTLHDDMSGELTVTGDGGGEPASPPPVDVVVGPDGGDGFDPATVTIAKGQSVNWHWGDDGLDVTFDDGTGSGSRPIGSFWGRTFTQTGEYGYRSRADGSAGKVIVTDPASAPSSGITPAPAGTTPSAEVTVGPGTSFAPADVTVDEGRTVRWSWAGGPHNVRFEDGTDSGFRSSGSNDLKFWTPGRFSFLCSAHAGMSGTVTVNDTGPAGPNEQPPDAGAVPPPADEPPPDGGSGTAPPSAVVTVGDGSSYFSPATVTVQTGQWVTWNWTGSVHNVHFADGADSGFKGSGSYSRRFLNPGQYDYRCDLHSGMTGLVVAEGPPVPDDGTPTTGGGGEAPSVGSAPPPQESGGAPAPSTAPSAAPARPGAGAAALDRAAPVLSRLRASLVRRRRGHRMRVTVNEDAMLRVTMRAVRRSRDPLGRRRFRLYARRGANVLRLPAMNLTARRYRLQVVAVDRAGNRSAAWKATIRGRR